MIRPEKILCGFVMSGVILLITTAGVLLDKSIVVRGEIWHRGPHVTWWSNTKAVEVRINKPDGDLFARSEPDFEGQQIWGTWNVPNDEGEQKSWAQKGVKFYLQDVSDDKPLTCDHTLAVMEW